MRRGTTPTFTFTVKNKDFDCNSFTALDIAFAQQDNYLFSKELADCTIDGNKITITLTEEETLLFDNKKNPVEIQLRGAIGKTKVASNIMLTTAEKILREGVLIDEI